MNTELLNLIARIVVIIIVVYLIPQIKRYLGSKGLLPYAESIVKGMELIHSGSGLGTLKKNDAVRLIKEYCSWFGLELSEDAISAVIEGAVEQLHILKGGAK